MATTRPRHRTQGAPRTPLNDALDAVTGSLNLAAAPVTTRRAGAVLALTSGLVASIAVPADAHLAPGNSAATVGSPTVDRDSGDGPWTWPSEDADDAADTEDAAPTDSQPDSQADSQDESEAGVLPPAAAAAKPAAAKPAAAKPAAAKPAAAKPAAAKPAARGSRVVAVAMRYRGVPYVWGGTTPRGFDCSGFTRYVYGQVGDRLPRTVAAQRNAVKRVPRSQARPGDLVFFGTHHVAIYLGGNRMIAAPRRGKTVQSQDIYSANVTFGRV